MKRKLLTPTALISLFVIAFFSSFLCYRYFFQKSLSSPPADSSSGATPKNIRVPETDSQPGDKSISVPKAIIKVVKDSPIQTRVFVLAAKNNRFSDKKIVVYEGDIVSIKFTAEDKGYDLTFPNFNVSQYAKNGGTKLLEFQTGSPGRYPFFCRTCEMSNKSKLNDAGGELIVVPRQT